MDIRQKIWLFKVSYISHKKSNSALMQFQNLTELPNIKKTSLDFGTPIMQPINGKLSKSTLQRDSNHRKILPITKGYDSQK